MTLRSYLAIAAVAGGALLVPRAARAQDIEVPILVMEAPETDTGESDEELDLANLVTAAAKGVTTVQEAPAIITIIPGDELRDRQTRNLEETLDLIPGFLRYGAMHGQYPFAFTRGTIQAMLYLRDGVSLFDGSFNAPGIGRNVHLELVKRIEVVSGPGGVLWGANSFMGVVNVITKDPEDVDGVEASAGFGDGDGDRGVYKGYVMAGLPRLGSDRVKLLVHVGFESYIGQVYKRSGHMFSTPLPNPNSLYIYGPEQEADPARSLILSFDGKLALGPVTLSWNIPYMERNFGVTFPGAVVQEDRNEDLLAECTPTGGGLDSIRAGDHCVDRGRASRRNQINWYDRYGALEYRTRFSRRAGLTVKGYFVQQVRTMDPIVILPPIPQLLEGGLTFFNSVYTYHAGTAFDGDVEVSNKVRVLYGGEAFYDWVADTVGDRGADVASRQGAGGEAWFPAPYDLTKLPLPCPKRGTWNGMQVMDSTFVEQCPVTFLFTANKTVLGAYASAQYRPTTKLILDGGFRLQVAPELFERSRGYDPVPIFSGAAVYEFAHDWHVKLNYAEGFRPPIFNNTDSNGEAVEIDGDRNLQTERSRSFQTEVNARLLKRKKRIRELNLRADYSYTTLENFITFVGGRYANVGDRGIHSAEFLAKLYLKGDHRIELGYTWLQIDMADKGAFDSVPEHWFNVGGVVSLVPGTLEATGIVRVLGAFEDPNRRVEYRDLEFDCSLSQFDGDGNVVGPCLPGYADPSNREQTVGVQPHEVVVDRIPPAAELQIGVRYRGMGDRLTVQATAYNALNATHYQPDAFDDMQPRLEILPHNYEAFRFFASATYNY